MAIVAIVGLDGCGKTTQARLLVQRLRGEGYRAIYMRPDFILADMVSSLTRSRINRFLPSPRKMRTLQGSPASKGIPLLSSVKRGLVGMLGYPYALISYVIVAVHSTRSTVVCDRFFYQFFFDLYGAWCRKVIRFFPRPNITFYLQGEPELFYPRMTNPFDRTVSPAYYVHVHKLHEKLAEEHRFVAIDARQDIDTINTTIFERVSSLYKRK